MKKTIRLTEFELTSIIKKIINEVDSEELDSDSNVDLSVGKVKTLYSGDQKKNVEFIINKLISKGITDPIAQIGVLCTIGKESWFTLKTEETYKGTISQVKEWFPPLRKLSDQKIYELQKSPVLFYEMVYGPLTTKGQQLGNWMKGDGYNFRGRGFNQLTGRSQYAAFGYDTNPDAVSTVAGSTDVALKTLVTLGSKLNNKFKTMDESIQYFVLRNNGGNWSSDAYSKALNQKQFFSIV